jgi:inorganic pyrophosphatase
MKPTDYLGKIVEIKIDRPYGSRDPKHGFIYELNYGYVTGAESSEGKGLEAYYLGVKAPISIAKGRCIAVIHRTENINNILIIIPEEKDDISDEEIEKLTWFQEKYFLHEIIRR